MKVLQVLSLVMLFSLFSGNADAQKSKKWKEATIKVSSQCGMCKDRIEKHLAFEKGVKKSVVDLQKDVVTVTYHSRKTSVEKIRKSLSKLGYDADDVKADKKAYDKLPGCCKKPDDPNHEVHGNNKGVHKE
ncbi:MAG: heavy metal-associated domain-containing protein [Bacteroidota bacterium]|nr:heavy metal-associated domain-containing protein [Bacteroidota bacterium]